MDHTPVQSSSVASYGYDPATKVLEIKYHGSGRTVKYQNVPYDVQLRLATAKSKGQFVHHVIKARYATA